RPGPRPAARAAPVRAAEGRALPRAARPRPHRVRARELTAMALEKAVLVNTATREVIRVQFNPEEYALDAGNNFAEFALGGRPTPPIQYVRGSGRSLRIELLFDSSGSLGDVRDLTRRVTGLLDKDPRRGAPPPLVFSWGRFDFACVLEKVG